MKDYYYPETTTSTLGYTLGRGARAIRVMTEEAMSPLKASAAVGAAWGGIAALINAGKYKRGRITKRDAVLDIAGESAGMGLAAGLGLLASNAVRASVLIASTSSLIPFTLGVVVTAGAKVIWDRTIKRGLRCEEKRP
ncbi:MAG: hypothetical protein DRG87_07045 [Deltaproteobacteria bacterium]|nr:MAG: hypothetical protein DRG87_07045 [Deltaproteobacteria bacterium]